MSNSYIKHTQNRYDYRLIAYYIWECLRNETKINRRSLIDFMNRIGRVDQTRESNFRHIFTWLVSFGFLVALSYTNNSFYAVSPFFKTMVDALAKKYNFEALTLEEVARLPEVEMSRSEALEALGALHD